MSQAHTAAMEARFAELPARAVEAMETQASFSCGPASIPPPSRTLEQTTSLPPGRESSLRLAEADAAVEADAVAAETE